MVIGANKLCFFKKSVPFNTRSEREKFKTPEAHGQGQSSDVHKTVGTTARSSPSRS